MITAAERDLILARLIAAGGPWLASAVFVGVFESIVDNGIATVIGDVTAPAGAAGTRQAVTTWSTATVKSDGRALVTGPTMEFRPADYTEATTVQGWYMATALTDGTLIAFGFFPEGPVSLPDETASVDVVARLVVDPTNGEWDSCVVFNGTA